jgi:hypothetical protein
MPRTRGQAGERAWASWFETALKRLLTMRVWHGAACGDLVLRSALARVSKDGPRKGSPHDLSFSRRMTSEFFHPSVPPRNRGRREGRVPFAPMVRVQQKKHAAEPQVRAGSSGLPCAMVLRLIRALPGETGLCCHRPCDAGSVVTSATMRGAHCAGHLHRGAGTTRFRRPHHAARRCDSHIATRRVHRIPLPTSVTIAKRPSCGGETRG